jgi:hypothetical protein
VKVRPDKFDKILDGIEKEIKHKESIRKSKELQENELQDFNQDEPSAATDHRAIKIENNNMRSYDDDKLL